MLKNFFESMRYFQSNYQEYYTGVNARIRTRLSCSDMQLFQDIIFMLGTQGWQEILDEQADMNTEETQESNASENPLDAIDCLVECFQVPLEGAAAEVSEIRGEFEALTQVSSSL